MLGLVSHEGADGTCQPVEGFIGPFAGMIAELGLEPLHAELITPCIQRLGDAVGVEKEQVSRSEAEGEIGAEPVEDPATVDADGHPLGVEAFDPAGGGAEYQRGIVTGPR